MPTEYTQVYFHQSKKDKRKGNGPESTHECCRIKSSRSTLRHRKYSFWAEKKYSTYYKNKYLIGRLKRIYGIKKRHDEIF